VRSTLGHKLVASPLRGGTEGTSYPAWETD